MTNQQNPEPTGQDVVEWRPILILKEMGYQKINMSHTVNQEKLERVIQATIEILKIPDVIEANLCNRQCDEDYQDWLDNAPENEIAEWVCQTLFRE